MLSLFLIGGLAIAQEVDTEAPAAIDDLVVSETTVSSITLTWTAPMGTPTSYDIRYATSTITNDNWDLAVEIDGEPTPQSASSSESMIVSGLEESTTYYFAVKSKDEAGNESDLSNVAEGISLTSGLVCGNGEIEGDEECDDGNTEDGDGCSSICKEEEEPEEPSVEVSFEMKATPRSLNTASSGNWITIHLFVNSPYSASQVDISTVKLNSSLSPDGNYRGLNHFSKGNKSKEKTYSNLVLKFSRAEVSSLVGSTTEELVLTLTGEINGKTFEAADTIDVLSIEPEQDETLIQAEGEPEVYMIRNKKRLHIPNPRAFSRRGLSWDDIEVVSQEELESYEEDTLIRAEEQSEVYIIYAGMKRHILSPEVFESYGFDWDNITIINKDELGDYPDVNLIREAGKEKVYMLAGGKKHWIPSVAVFNSKGYKWENVIIVNSSEAEVLGEGNQVD